VVVGRGVGSATPTAPDEIKIKLGTSAKKALRRLHKVTFHLLVAGKDAQGRTTLVRKRFKLKR
jgi:hypothetical protein